MGKRRLAVLTGFIMTIVVSGGVGYFAAWAVGYYRIAELYVMAHCDAVFVESQSMIRHMDRSGPSGLIDAVEYQYDMWDTVLRGIQPASGADDKERISRALGAWAAARKKLEGLRSSYEMRKEPNAIGN